MSNVIVQYERIIKEEDTAEKIVKRHAQFDSDKEANTWLEDMRRFDHDRTIFNFRKVTA